jgi:hypothetical protein
MRYCGMGTMQGGTYPRAMRKTALEPIKAL